MNINESSKNKYYSSNNDINNKNYKAKKVKVDNMELKQESFVEEESNSEEDSN